MRHAHELRRRAGLPPVLPTGLGLPLGREVENRAESSPTDAALALGRDQRPAGRRGKRVAQVGAQQERGGAAQGGGPDGGALRQRPHDARDLRWRQLRRRHVPRQAAGRGLLRAGRQGLHQRRARQVAGLAPLRPRRDGRGGLLAAGPRGGARGGALPRPRLRLPGLSGCGPQDPSEIGAGGPRGRRARPGAALRPRRGVAQRAGAGEPREAAGRGGGAEDRGGDRRRGGADGLVVHHGRVPLQLLAGDRGSARRDQGLRSEFRYA
mmetsp:Transcript_7989/g.23412  ORF Transcript_7989/g.23412 Transcript_7989/m.23412 type:complete len:266 (-) Transcript_7989:361-1158(-)